MNPKGIEPCIHGEYGNCERCKMSEYPDNEMRMRNKGIPWDKSMAMSDLNERRAREYDRTLLREFLIRADELVKASSDWKVPPNDRPYQYWNQTKQDWVPERVLTAYWRQINTFLKERE